MNIYIITYEGMAIHGISLMAYLLAERNVNIVYLGSSLDVVKSKEEMWIKPTLAIEDFDLAKCDALIVPGGLPSGFSSLPWLGDLLKSAREKGILIGSICASAQTLAVHGLLKNCNYTSSYDFSGIPGAEGSTNTKKIVERDGQIITARGQGFLEFMLEIMRALRICDEREVRWLYKRYRPGRRTIKWKLKPYIESQWK